MAKDTPRRTLTVQAAVDLRLRVDQVLWAVRSARASARASSSVDRATGRPAAVLPLPRARAEVAAARRALTDVRASLREMLSALPADDPRRRQVRAVDQWLHALERTIATRAR